MKHIKYAWLGIMLIGSSIPDAALSKTVTLISSEGENVHFEVEPAEPFLTVLDTIQSFYDSYDCECYSDQSRSQDLARETLLNNPSYDFEVTAAGITVRSKKTAWRDYSESVSKKEKEDIKYIVRTLATESLISIGLSSSSLNKAGKRIEHLHPYRFLMTIFTDEELKAGAHAIRDRGGMTWDGFIDGATGSLKTEAAKGNLLQFTSDFAKKVKIDESLIKPSLESGKWVEFVNILIDKIPREIDPNRYDM